MKIEVKNITGGYGKKIVCRDISFELASGEVICVAGPNGSGKSTLFRLMLRFNPLLGGEILFDGRPLSAMNQKELAAFLAYIPQNHNPVFAYSVLELSLIHI